MAMGTEATGLAAALGVGLLIGLERERRKSAGGGQAPGGVRTFALAAMLGALAMHAGREPLLIAATLGVCGLLAVAYFRSRDEDLGLTTEITMIVTVILGGLAMVQPALAASAGVVVVVLLAARGLLHGFARDTLTDRELRDGLILATVALVIWPLLPDRPIGPFDALNLHSLWTLVVLVLTVGAAGYVGTRLLGPRLGLPFTGFASGFISSAATISAMGQKASASPPLLASAVAGAMLSTVATFIQLGLVLTAINPPMFWELLPMLAAGGLTALLYAGIFALHPLGSPDDTAPANGDAFDLRAALILALVVAAILISTAILNRFYGASGVLVGTILSGFADVHAPTAALASLVAGGQIALTSAVLPFLAAVTTNAVSKAVVAVASRNRMYFIAVLPGLVLSTAAAWICAWVLRGAAEPNWQ